MTLLTHTDEVTAEIEEEDYTLLRSRGVWPLRRGVVECLTRQVGVDKLQLKRPLKNKKLVIIIERVVQDLAQHHTLNLNQD